MEVRFRIGKRDVSAETFFSTLGRYNALVNSYTSGKPLKRSKKIGKWNA